MSVSAVKEEMLYCPKCQQTYEDGTQRFCTNEGNRLLPVKSAKPTNGVFSNLLGRVSSTDAIDKKLSPTPKFTKIKPVPTDFIPPIKPRVFKTEEEVKAEMPPPAQKPLPRIIKPSEIPTSQARLGNRQTNPTGRPALTWANPNVLLGQTVKGRYFVVEKLGEDESSIAYLAQDKLAADKKVVVRVLMDEDADDVFTNQIFAEERVSLSLINHPNIARTLDSGELSEGKPFIISEYIEGKSVREMLKQTGQFNSLRAARVIRQAAYALSEVHQNGVLHRNLKPENIILTVSDGGSEQVKLVGFGVSKGNKNLEYKSPEQVAGNLASYAGDIYALAAIAFQMLTNRLPFYASSVEDLSKAQQTGLKLRPTNLRLDVPPTVDAILEKALAFNQSERYPKARDFGDAFFNALSATAPWEKDKETDEIEIISDETKTESAIVSESATAFVVPDVEKETPEIETLPIVSDIHISPREVAPDEDSETIGVKATENLAWEKRSPEPPQVISARQAWLAILGLAIVFVGIWLMWQYVLNRPSETVFVEPPTQTAEVVEPLLQVAAPPSEEIEQPILPRTITQPPDSIYFQNKKEDLKGDTAKNFLGFSLYYPKDWKQNDAKGKFLDISNNAPSGAPIEQMLVTYYDSKGTFAADAETFPTLVKETNASLKKLLPNYEMVSEGKRAVNNGWQAYEIKFKNVGKTKNGENITLWGRRLFIPAGLRGMKNGYVITMLATSLSPDVKNVDDVGVKGKLASILETFEPNQNF